MSLPPYLEHGQNNEEPPKKNICKNDRIKRKTALGASTELCTPVGQKVFQELDELGLVPGENVHNVLRLPGVGHEDLEHVEGLKRRSVNLFGVY